MAFPAVIPALVGAFQFVARCGGGTLLKNAFSPAAMGARLGMAPSSTAADQTVSDDQDQQPTPHTPSEP